MIVPEYWAEARAQARHRRRMVTVRRFGWSDEGADAAQAHAEARAQHALQAILAGQALPRRERRSNYGIEGVPIREQIVERHDAAVVTRNSYGALCLNVPDVLFVDMDFAADRAAPLLGRRGSIAVLAAGFLVGLSVWGPAQGVGLALLALAAACGVVVARRALSRKRAGGDEGLAVARAERFSSAHPDWHLRLYRTPAGLRVLAMHRTFSPQDAEVAALFAALRADRLYALMCRLQHCFRARLTAKPWRIGLQERIRPPVAAWSREQALLPERLAWIARYERAASGFAACRYLRSLGDVARVDPRAERIRALHDTLSRADGTLPLA